MDIDFFKDNKYGYKTTEKWLKFNNIELYNSVMNYYPDILSDFKLNRRLYHYFNNISILPKCDCENNCTFINFSKGYSKFCSVYCSNINPDTRKRRGDSISNTISSDEHQDKIKKTNRDKFGYDYLFNIPGYTKEHFRNKYGVDNPMFVKSIKDKVSNTNIIRYGEKSYLNTSEQIEENRKSSKLYFFEHTNSLLKNTKLLKNTEEYKYLVCNDCLSEFKIKSTTLYGRIRKKQNECIYCEPLSKSTSFMETEWLNSLKISNEYRQHKLVIDKSNYIVDGFDPKTKTIYEFYGDYWHGNPEIFNPDDFNKSSKKRFGELYERTINREIKLLNNNYNLVTIWEYDLYKKK